MKGCCKGGRLVTAGVHSCTQQVYCSNSYVLGNTPVLSRCTAGTAMYTPVLSRCTAGTAKYWGTLLYSPGVLHSKWWSVSLFLSVCVHCGLLDCCYWTLFLVHKVLSDYKESLIMNHFHIFQNCDSGKALKLKKYLLFASISNNVGIGPPLSTSFGEIVLLPTTQN